MAMVIDRKPRIRDHGQFWVWFAIAVMAALVLVGVAFIAAGITLAATFIAVEAAIAMALGIR